MPPDLVQIVQSCVQRVRRWRVPPRWSHQEWLDEATAQGHASACEAWADFDGNRSACASTFVQGRVMAGILTLYRREWTHTTRLTPETASPQPGDETQSGTAARAVREAGDRRSSHRGPQATPLWENSDLQRAMGHLAIQDQKLLRQLFWEERSETEIALALGISQPAVNKRKQRVLSELKAHLKNNFENFS